MPNFRTPDGTRLAYHVLGEGAPLLCVPGGPMQASAYLGDLGGPRRQLILLDLRGTGDSERPADLATCRADRLVADVDALRGHLDLDTVDLLAHSAGANLALRYVEAHPDRVARLVLVTPSVFAVGLDISGDARREMIDHRVGETWFESASQAFERIAAGQGDPADWDAIAPCYYGRWDEAAKAHSSVMLAQGDQTLAEAFRAEGAFDPPATRAALTGFTAPVLVVAGEVDIAAPPKIIAEYTTLLPNAELVIQPNAGHTPWLDDPKAFAATVDDFLDA